MLEVVDPIEARRLLERQFNARAVAWPPPPRRLARIGKRITPASLRPHVRIALTDLVRARERSRASRLAAARPLRLQLGSAGTPKDGWVNVDLVGATARDLSWNLVRPLPFADGTVDAIFHEHVLEHFSLEQGLALADDAFRVLRPGGVLRIGVPDAAACVRDYAQGDGSLLAALRPGCATAMLALHDVFSCCGHRTMYDFETLSLLLNAAGFEAVEERPFGESRIEPCPDSEHRRFETIFVEAVR